MDKVTTTDELIPSGGNVFMPLQPLGLAGSLSRRDPGYVQRAKDVRALEKARLAGEAQSDEALKSALGKVKNILPDVDEKTIEIGSVIYCVKPGDGSARAAGNKLPARLGRPCEYLLRVCHQALPLQRDELGHAAVPDEE